MGCCASTPSAGDDDVPAVRAHSSSRNITAPSTRRASQASQPGVQQQIIDDRPNAPLKAIPTDQRSQLPNALTASTPTARVKPLTDPSNATWTPSRLEKERRDWWDTQVTGNAEIWGAIRMAVQSLQSGELQTAQAMLDVTGCTCPTGLLWRGVYDPTGVQYKVPEWVIVQPEGLAEENEAATGKSFTPTWQIEAVNGADTGEVVKIKVRTSHDQRDLIFSIGKKELVWHIIKRIQSLGQLKSDSNVRIVYGGRIYQLDETLDSNQYWNFDNGHVLTALVSP
ncbi:hypothetical protein T440DRAFT_474436 [Plenodomus tracheiphilus IPT5]|uniref:DC-UbP/UBTD2 N-terminal domain-containing protein n=1 Tax=Plenodomus tracheiphilus IPT5 TaxID=1408161 RepID=A0A6A7BKV1_9PLEO|nr:hypothetical protein T440DRAFT_474436 [Plenodomus tracheiphilus IPT5]